MRPARIVTEQNSTGIVRDSVVGHSRMIYPAEVDAFTAIKPFIRLERGQPGASRSRRVKRQIIVQDVVFRNRHRGCVGDENALEFGVLDGKSRYHHLTQTRIIETVDIYPVSLADRIDGRVRTIGTDQRERLTYSDVALYVCSWRDIDGIARVRCVNCLADRGITAANFGIYTQGGSGRRAAHARQPNQSSR